MNKTSLTTIVLSQSENISPLLLDSISFSDQIVILVDAPKSRPKKNQNKTIYFHPLSDNFAKHRNYALSKIHTQWALFLDADEYLPSETIKEIEDTIQNTSCSGFKLKRVDVCWGFRFLHGEVKNQQIVRLARKDSGKFIRPVHEVWKISGTIGEISNPLYHTKDHFISEFIPRMNHYGPIDAEILKKEGKDFSWIRLFVYPKAKFLQNYFLRLGFLDGLQGLFLSYLMSIQSLTVRIFQWEKISSQK